MSRHLFTLEEVEPLLEGLAILGTGGGGSPAWGREILLHDLQQGRKLEVVSPEDIEDEATVVCGGIMGSVKVLDAISPGELVRRWEEDFELLRALKVMEDLLRSKINYIVPFEVGGLNTPVILSAGARLGIPVIDGDGLGRAAPETQMTSFIGHGISLTPMPLVDARGNVVIVKEATSLTYPDELGRWVVTRGGGLGANCHYPMSGRQLKESVIPHTVTRALDLGRAVREARAQRRDPVKRIEELIGGRRLFTGLIRSIREEDREGFYFTSVRLESEGKRAQIVIQNEAMLCFINDRAAVVFPDLICMLDPATGRGLMSMELREGMEIAVFGAPCHGRLKVTAQTESGKRAFSPSRFGYPEIEYQPFEELTLASLGEEANENPGD